MDVTKIDITKIDAKDTNGDKVKVVAGSPDGRYAFVGSRGGIAICDFRVHLQG